MKFRLGNSIADDIPDAIRTFDGGLTVAVIGPVLEEAAFRLIPGLISDKAKLSNKQSMALGAVSSAVFAWTHSLKTPSKEVPLLQGGIGFALWCIAKKWGVPKAVAAHMALNSLALTAVWVVGSPE